MITIVSPGRKIRVSRPFHLKLKFDFKPEEGILGIYSSPYKSGTKPICVREVKISTNLLIDFLPNGTHEVYVAALKGGKVVQSEPIVVDYTGPDMKEEEEDQEVEKQPEENLEAENQAQEAEEAQDQEDPEVDESGWADAKCGYCRRPLSDCGCGRRHIESAPLIETCSSCGGNKADCGCGKRKRPPVSQSSLEGKEERCNLCGESKADCGCGKHKKPPVSRSSLRKEEERCDLCGESKADCGCGGHKNPPHRLQGEESGHPKPPHKLSEEPRSQILIVHRSATIPEWVSEVVVVRNSEPNTVLRLPDTELAYQTVTITNYSERNVPIVPEAGTNIETFEGSWLKVDQATLSTIALIPSGPQKWYLRENR